MVVCCSLTLFRDICEDIEQITVTFTQGCDFAKELGKENQRCMRGNDNSYVIQAW